MKNYIKKFSVPSWIVLLFGIVLDFILVLAGKYVAFPVKVSTYFDATLPAFTTGCAFAFILMNIPKWYREYKAK